MIRFLKISGVFRTTVRSVCGERQLLINCRRTNLNFYANQKYAAYDEKILASRFWRGRKSTGDYFTVLPQQRTRHPNDVDIDRETFTFSELDLDRHLVNVLDRNSIRNPTEIQLKTVPYLLNGRNALIVAETGCGKTLAYLLPFVQQILDLKRIRDENKPIDSPDSFNNPFLVILAPSRELVEQIGSVAKSLFAPIGLVTKTFAGSVRKTTGNPPVAEIDIAVFTIGAYLHMLTFDVVRNSRTRFLVLDEADSLLDDSFGTKVDQILARFNFREATMDTNRTQLALVSATMPRFIPQWLALHIDPDTLKRVTTHEIHQLLPETSQRFVRVSKSMKAFELLKLVRSETAKHRSVIVFSNGSKRCDWISLFLNGNGIKCANLNADVPQAIRNENYRQFQTGMVRVLSCTDLGSRGLDTVNVSHIINYDFPTFMADYIHRCGRTGRVGSPANCKITNFISSSNEIKAVQQLEMSLRKNESLPHVDGNIKAQLTKSR